MCSINSTCKGKVKYGGYCFKHREYYLLDDKGIIRMDRFTNKISDYLVKDINKTNMYYKQPVYNSNKKRNFETLKKLICSLEVYFDKTQEILNAQKIWRKLIISKRNGKIKSLRGEGFNNLELCNNENDFYTYDNLKELDMNYFFSYKDVNGFIWFFDIRSFNQLIKSEEIPLNPYTRETIPQNVIDRSIILTNYLKSGNFEEISILTEELQRRDGIKQKTIDLFSKIEYYGYECHFDWFLRLNRDRLIKLYKNLEDIWNYRLQINDHTKSRLSPPDGRMFTVRIHELPSYSLISLQELIINEVSKFDNALTAGDKKLGFMYFIIGLGSVSVRCWNSHSWLQFV